MLRIALSAIATGAYALVSLPGCSLVYDPSDLPLGADGGEEDAPDAGDVDAAPPADAEPDDLDLDIEPGAVFEGAGSSGAPIPVLLRGEGLSAEMTIRTDSDLIEIESIEVGDDGELAAAAIRVSVEPQLPGGQIHVVTLTVEQPGARGTVELDVVGLNELPLSGSLLEVGQDSFDELYSSIETTGDVSLIGDHPARLVATGAITVSHDIDASGGLTDRRTPGAGGCAGGEEASDGECRGRGRAGSSGGGGGGAGHGDEGTDGAGEGGGERGGEVFNGFITPLGGDEGARGSGGGGGHGGGIGSGGEGGGGGGVLELTSWGDVRLDARVIADGAAGGTGGGGVTCGGGGGGGSGGALLVRAGAAFTSAGGSLLARGGSRGAGSCNASGGEGGPGRIRIDAGRVNLPADLEVEGVARRGPMWRDELPAIVRAPTLEIDYRAQPSFTYRATLGGDVVDDDDPDVSGRGRLTVELAEGLNEVCLVLPDGFDDSLPESKNCRDIAYVP